MSKSVGAMVVALVIAFVYGWQIALLSFAFVPVMAFCQAMLYSVFMGDAADKDRAEFEAAGQCTTEATMNIRTGSEIFAENSLEISFHPLSELLPLLVAKSTLSTSTRKNWIHRSKITLRRPISTVSCMAWQTRPSSSCTPQFSASLPG